MKNTFIMAFLCLMATAGLTAGTPAPASTNMANQENDSSFYDRIRADIKNKKSFYAFEFGLTAGQAFSPGQYFGFDYFQKSERLLNVGLFFNYSVFHFDRSVNYQGTSRELEDSYGSSSRTYTTYRTRDVTYAINRINVSELGLSVRYNLTKKFTIKAAGTVIISQRLIGGYDDQYTDSIFVTDEAEGTRLSSINRGSSGGSFYDKYVPEEGIQNLLSVHLGAEQKISKRLRITARASIPFGSIFPEKMNYEPYFEDAGIELSRQPTTMPKRPLFFKAGISWTF